MAKETKQKTGPKFYVLWGLDAITGVLRRYNIYRQESSAYRAKRRESLKAPTIGFWVKTMTQEDLDLEEVVNSSAEKELKELEEESIKFIDDNIHEIFSKIDSVFNESHRNGLIDMIVTRHGHEAVLQLAEVPETTIIESIFLRVKESSETERYITEIGIQLTGYSSISETKIYELAASSSYHEMEKQLRENDHLEEVEELFKDFVRFRISKSMTLFVYRT